jgi:hypothetical protein
VQSEGDPGAADDRVAPAALRGGIKGKLKSKSEDINRA